MRIITTILAVAARITSRLTEGVSPEPDPEGPAPRRLKPMKTAPTRA